MESQSVEELQILYDFKIFIREGLFYIYTDNLLTDFTNYMDNLYYPLERKYNDVLLKIFEQNDLLFSPSNCDLINDNHLEQIKEYIRNYNCRYNLKRVSRDDIKMINVALYDFKMCIEEGKLINFSDFYYFAHYMKSFYPRYPYYEAANLLCLMNKNKDGLVDIDFYINFLSSECINVKDCYFGHCAEIWNFTREKNILYNYSNKILVKE